MQTHQYQLTRYMPDDAAQPAAALPKPDRLRVKELSLQEAAIQYLGQLPHGEKPVNRLLHCGAGALATDELLACVFGLNGHRHADAQHLLSAFEGLPGLAQATIYELQQHPGIGPARAAQVKAVLELGPRGFGWFPVHGLEGTVPIPGFQGQGYAASIATGHAFVATLPLLDVAQAWGLTVATCHSSEGRALGYAQPGQQIGLGVANLSNWARSPGAARIGSRRSWLSWAAQCCSPCWASALRLTGAARTITSRASPRMARGCCGRDHTHDRPHGQGTHCDSGALEQLRRWLPVILVE